MLVEYFVVENKYPTFKVRKIPPRGPLIEKAAAFIKPRKFKVVGDFGQAICLPDSKKYNIMINIGLVSLTIEPV